MSNMSQGIISDEGDLTNAGLALLSKKTGISLKAQDYKAWLEGEGPGLGAKFDRAVLQYLGLEVYDALQVAARMDCGLSALLAGKPDSFSMGGVRLGPFRKAMLAAAPKTSAKTHIKSLAEIAKLSKKRK